TRLLFFTARGAPVKNRNRQSDRGRHARMFFQARPFQRISIKAAVDRITKRGQTIRARYSYLLARGAKLLIKLCEFRPARNIIRFELLILSVNREKRQVCSANRS